MQINAVNIRNEGKLIADYRENKEEIINFFDYQPYQSYEQRAEELHSRKFERMQLSEVLEKMNTSWGADPATIHNIQQLKNPETVVVIGGQQAGLLTGPLYTVNKVISILQLAKQQQEELNIPVVPVFWIAGEDHDYEEINHVYMPGKFELKKKKFKQASFNKSSVSHVKLNKEACEDWIDELFSSMEETAYTKDLYKMVSEALQKSLNITDFFARLIFKLFPDQGLVLIDSAHPDVRNLETDYFIQLIENQSKISHGVYEASLKLENLGYSLSLELSEEDGHLFYHKDNERILLERTEDGNWKGKLGEVQLMTEELIHIARTNPENLSNNVVTRPLMQEMLLPALAFVGGPGEIGYWAALKPAFHALGLKMPPVVPRLSFTYVPRNVKKALDATGISLESAVQQGVEAERKEWIRNKQRPSIDGLAEDLKATIEKAHHPLRELSASIRADVSQLSEKNLQFLLNEVDFLKNRMNLAWEEMYDKDLNQFNLIQMTLYPDRGFQERKWHPLPLINEYGGEFILKTAEHPCSFTEKHYVVYL